MAKSIRSKVKKRLRSVKRGVLKRELADPASKLGVPQARVKETLAQAATGYIKPGKKKLNAFRSDDQEAEIPQHNWRQGPDFRAQKVGVEAGYALVGASRPKKGKHGGDAPSASVHFEAPPQDEEAMADAADAAESDRVQRLRTGTEQLVPFGTNKRSKRKLKNKSGIVNEFRWT